VIVDERDEELVLRTLAGDTRAFAVLVERYRRAALARALAVVGDPAEADDVAQEAFIQAYQRLMLCDPPHFGGWLLTIVYRRALNHARSMRRRREVPLSPTIPAASRDNPLEQLGRRDLRTELLAALRQLSPVQRSVVLFAEMEHWPHERIAQTLGISIVMSRRVLSDARKRLRQILQWPNA
jgi:RNA polymerase sigma-70 factor (ECF subfamily)